MGEKDVGYKEGEGYKGGYLVEEGGLVGWKRSGGVEWMVNGRKDIEEW